MDRIVAISEIKIFQNYDFRLFVRFLDCRIFTIYTNDFVDCRIFTIYTNDFVYYDGLFLMIRVLVLNNQKSELA